MSYNQSQKEKKNSTFLLFIQKYFNRRRINKLYNNI